MADYTAIHTIRFRDCCVMQRTNIFCGNEAHCHIAIECEADGFASHPFSSSNMTQTCEEGDARERQVTD